MPIVTLVNANEMRPAVGPIALDYLAAALELRGCQALLLDLTWASDPERAVAAHFREHRPDLVGFTLRNTDDCYLAGRYSCLPHARRTLALLRRYTEAPLVVGGCGYSLLPEVLLAELEADFGIAGDGEEALPQLAHALVDGGDGTDIPGLVFKTKSGVRRNPALPVDLASLPPPARNFVDNARYWREGGQGGFETKRGCSGHCVYCADPVVKGHSLRLRRPDAVAQEVVNLANRGVTDLHTCDAEFNLPREHALAVCEALIARRLPERVRWWAYCAPEEFDDELAGAMKRAGCVGIDFGADHGCDEQLARLGRRHRAADLERVADACKRHGLVFMFDLLLGGPGETHAGIRATLDLMRRLEPSRVGLSVGVRLYPGTPLAAQVMRGPLAQQPGLLGEVEDNDSLLRPIFYVDPGVGPEISEFVADLVRGDQRFFCPDPAAEVADYNYRENPILVDAITRGYRGAYWDILRRLQEGLPP